MSRCVSPLSESFPALFPRRFRLPTAIAASHQTSNISMETAHFTKQQLADLEAGGIKIANAITTGGNWEEAFNGVFGCWNVDHGVPVPTNLNPNASSEEKWAAARKRLMFHLCYHACLFLRQSDRRLRPLMQYHLSDLTKIVRTANALVDADQEIEDVVMGDAEEEAKLEASTDALVAALSQLRVAEE
ncbi:hypothetical protein NMY22_g3297 [Coprinellus aureogranulatus]|nr:hypothetical protein NMY22_g3297 [Coprinellus aureogranulatus]